MLNIQIVTVTVVAVMGLGFEFLITRKAANSIANSGFAYSYAGGGFVAWAAVLSMAPGVVALWLLHLAFGWDYQNWVAILLATVAVILMFVAIYAPRSKRTDA